MTGPATMPGKATSRRRDTLALGVQLVAHLEQVGSATARELAQLVGTTPKRVRFLLSVVHETGPVRLLSIRITEGRRGRPATRYAIDPAPATIPGGA